MPKDPTRNVDRYKIRGGDINEFEYDQNREQLAKQKPTSGAKLIPGTPPEKREGRRTTKKTTARKGAAKKK